MQYTKGAPDVLLQRCTHVLDNGKVILYGPKEEVLLEEKKFNNLGLALPFMAELSIKLKYYDLIDDLIFDMDEMVNKLWK